jgi:hypothetical protein
MPLICTRDQCRSPAALWHDGQITYLAGNRVERAVIGAMRSIKPGVHNHDREHGYQTAAGAAFGMTKTLDRLACARDDAEISHSTVIARSECDEAIQFAARPR